MAEYSSRKAIAFSGSHFNVICVSVLSNGISANILPCTFSTNVISSKGKHSVVPFILRHCSRSSSMFIVYGAEWIHPNLRGIACTKIEIILYKSITSSSTTGFCIIVRDSASGFFYSCVHFAKIVSQAGAQ